jgi:hypothetical protein
MEELVEELVENFGQGVTTKAALTLNDRLENFARYRASSH